MAQLEVDCFARTDVGGRNNNEDAFLVCDLGSGDTSLHSQTRRHLGVPGLLLLVSDGMGGVEGGEVASTLAVGSAVERRSFVRLAANWPSASSKLPFTEQAAARH